MTSELDKAKIEKYLKQFAHLGKDGILHHLKETVRSAGHCHDLMSEKYNEFLKQRTERNQLPLRREQLIHQVKALYRLPCDKHSFRSQDRKP